MPVTTVRRLVTAVAALALTCVVLSGCLYAAIPAETTRPTGTATTAPPDTDGVPADLLPYYGQTLDWTACGTGFDCTTVTAPLDWKDTSKGDIHLAVTRHRATHPQGLGSLLYNPGGPGASGWTYVHDYLLQGLMGQALIDAYDVVGFDPRGVGQSTAVKCYDDAGLDEYYFGHPQNARGTDAWRAELTAKNQAFADSCEANSGGILPYVTTDYSARDVDLLRAVLGDKKLNWLGQSYGTLLGATYAGLFPDKVGRMVLDGAEDPSQPTWQAGAVQAAGFESALKAYMADCLKGSDCPFSGTVDQALADLSTLLAQLDTSPITASDGRLLDGGNLYTAISEALYATFLWPTLTQALSDALQGTADQAFALADEYFDRNPDGTYSDNLIQEFYATTCVDWSTPDQSVDEDKAEALVEQTAPIVAPYWNTPSICDVWPYPGTGTAAPITADGAPPIVVIGTTNDPATPYQQAVALAKQLSSGVLVSRQGDDHTAYGGKSACIDDAVESFLVDGTVPQDGLMCQ